MRTFDKIRGMKKSAKRVAGRLLPAAGLFLMLGVEAGAEENLFPNGDFEKWTAEGRPEGWDQWSFWRPGGGATPAISCETNKPHHGRKYLRFTTRFDNHHLRRSLELKPNTEYALSCALQSVGGYFAIWASDAATPEPNRLFTERRGRTKGWERAVILFKTLESGTVQFYFSCNSNPIKKGGEINILLDNILLIDLSPLPSQGILSD